MLNGRNDPTAAPPPPTATQDLEATEALEVERAIGYYAERYRKLHRIAALIQTPTRRRDEEGKSCSS